MFDCELVNNHDGNFGIEIEIYGSAINLRNL